MLHNVDVAERTDRRTRFAPRWREQAASPVRWVETIQAFAARGVTHVVECGPGSVLAGLNKRIDARAQSRALTDGADIEAARQRRRLTRR